MLVILQKKIKENVFYGEHKSTHNFDEMDEERSLYYCNSDENKYIYEQDNTTISLNKIDLDLINIKSVNDKIKYLDENIVNNNNKNRFYKSK